MNQEDEGENLEAVLPQQGDAPVVGTLPSVPFVLVDDDYGISHILRFSSLFPPVSRTLVQWL